VVSGTRAAGLTSTAELTWGLVHALNRSLPAEDRCLREGAWQQTVGRDLHGARPGIIGLGGVGSRVARVGVAFGMDVVAWSTHLDPGHAKALGVTPVSKQELLTTSDVVTLHLDVRFTEPLPADSPWHSAPRTVLAPHLGYVTTGAYEIFYRDALADVLAYAAGEPLRVLTP
jgi:phosphoglycerate dehydrogenase-like enzyme